MSDKRVAVGDLAPDFELQGTGNKTYKLSDYRGSKVVLAFYPGDNSAVCTLQLKNYNQNLRSFGELGAQLLAISPQGVESHDSFCEKHDFGFPLLADTDKQVAADYGILGPLGFPRRSIFVIDRDGTIMWVHRSMAGMTYRSSDELLAILSDK